MGRWRGWIKPGWGWLGAIALGWFLVWSIPQVMAQAFPPVPPKGDLRIAVISDLNSAFGSTDYEPEVDRVVALLPQWQPDVVLCAGDMVAGQRHSLTDGQVAAMWRAFDQRVAAPLRRARIPLGVTIGNHDGSGARQRDGRFSFQRDRDFAQRYWQDPAHNPGITFVDRHQFPFYYTFRVASPQGSVFVLVWDGSTNTLPAEQLAWVESALASPAARQANLRLVLGHLPLYGVAIGRNQGGEVMHQGDRLRSLLERYQVHTYISGHHHAYYPGRRGALQLLHTGALGGGPRRLIAGDRPPQKTVTLLDIDFNRPEPVTDTTYSLSGPPQRLPPSVLPRFLAGFNGLVLRRDLRPEDLTPAERQRCRQQIDPALCIP